MTSRCPAGPPAVATVNLEPFLDLMCADEELLRAEFEAIVAAAWPRPPSRRAVVHVQHGESGGPAHGPACLRSTEPPPVDHDPAIDASARQRSPPRPAPWSDDGARDEGGDLPVQSTDPYAVLGVSSDATQAEITHVYRRLVRRHHPGLRDDGVPQAGGSGAALQRVLHAYALLRDPERLRDREAQDREPASADRRAAVDRDWAGRDRDQAAEDRADLLALLRRVERSVDPS